MSDFPYPGLRSYKRDETDIFFGREEHTDILIKHLKDTHFLAVVGPSGCGKSSLVRTGLLAALETGFMASAGGSWRIAELRPGNCPFARLAEAFLVDGLMLDNNTATIEFTQSIALLQASLRRGPHSVHELLAATPLPDNTTLLLLIDQFEEIFRYYQHGDKNEAAAFVKLLLTSSTHPAVYVVITMRSDFIGDGATFYGLPEAINQGLFLTPRLTRTQLREAIELPAAVFGGEVEANLVNHLLNEVGTDPDKLPQLQHALMRIWQLAHFENPNRAILTLTHYKQIGGLENALSQHADKAYAELEPEQQQIAEILFRSLSERSQKYRDTRRPVELSEVAKLANVSWQQVATCTEVFRKAGRSFLMPPLDQALTPDTVLDISHESLIQRWHRLKKWTGAEAKSANMYHRLEETALLNAKGKAELWKGLDLENALDWLRRENPTPIWAKRYGKNEDQYFDQSMRFLTQSEKRQQHEKQEKEATRQRQLQRARQQVIIAVFGLIIMFGLSIWGLIERHTALEQKKLAQLATQQVDAIKKDRTKHLFESTLNEAVLLTKNENYAAAKKVLKETYELDKEVPIPRHHARNLLVWFSKVMGGAPFKKYSAGATLFEVAVSADGHFLAAAGEKGTLILFDIDNDQLLQQQILSGHQGYVLTVAFHPQNQWLASAGSDDKQIILWSLSTSQPIHQWTAPDKVYALAVSPNGAYLASGGEDNQITLWEVETGRTLCTFKGHTNRISDGGLAFHPKGELLASSSWDKTARLWLVSTCGEYKTLSGHADYVEKLTFAPDGKTLATSSSDKNIRLWDVKSGNTLRVLQGHKGEVYGLSFLKNGTHLVSSSFDRTLRLWDLESGVTLRVLQGHIAAVNAVTSYADDILSASSNSTIMLWDTTLPYQQLVDLSEEKPASTAIAPSGKSVAVGFANGTLHLYSLPSLRLLWQVESAHDRRIHDIAFNADSTLLATAGFDREAKLWQVKKGTLKQVFSGHQDVLSAVAFSPDSQHLATASYDGQIGLFSVGEEQKRFYQIAQDGLILSIDFDSSGTRLLSSGGDGYTQLWHFKDSQLTLLKKFPKAQDKIMWASFSPDDQLIATVGREQLIRIYSSHDFQEQHRLEGHRSTIYRVIFSPDNQQVVTASADATIRFWDLSNDSELFALNLPAQSAYSVPLRDFDFRCTPSGCWIAVPLTRGKLALYELGMVY